MALIDVNPHAGLLADALQGHMRYIASLEEGDIKEQLKKGSDAIRESWNKLLVLNEQQETYDNEPLNWGECVETILRTMGADLAQSNPKVGARAANVQLGPNQRISVFSLNIPNDTNQPNNQSNS